MKVGIQGELLLKAMEPYVDRATNGRLYADLHDLTECCRWLIGLVDKDRQEPLSQDEMEEMMIEIDIAFIQHVSFHLKTFRKDINRLLANMPADPVDEATE